MAFAPARLVPPFRDAPLAEGDQFSKPWVQHHQDVTDRLATLDARVGVTDGSDAVAGAIGEYVGATFGAVALAGGGAAADVGSIALTAGDWDVAGSVVFASSAGNLISVVAWLTTVSVTFQDPGASAINTNVGATRFTAGTRLVVGPRRLNVTTTTTVYLDAAAAFPAGTAEAAGHIGARRMR